MKTFRCLLGFHDWEYTASCMKCRRCNTRQAAEGSRRKGGMNPPPPEDGRRPPVPGASGGK